MSERDQILAALGRWVAQRPGLEWQNYGCGPDAARAYRQDAATIRRQKRDFGQLALLCVALGVTAEELRYGFSAYNRRLTLVDPYADSPDEAFEFTAGQYWPTEYRAAAVAVLNCAAFDAVRRRFPDGGGWVDRDAAKAWLRKQPGGKLFIARNYD